jgi:hypothetical protein
MQLVSHVLTFKGFLENIIPAHEPPDQTATYSIAIKSLGILAPGPYRKVLACPTPGSSRSDTFNPGNFIHSIRALITIYSKSVIWHGFGPNVWPNTQHETCLLHGPNSTISLREFHMNPKKPKHPMPLATEVSTTTSNESVPSQEVQSHPPFHPDQTGAQYGGYGHADNSFGRDAGSSSKEGGQGADKSGADRLSFSKPLKDVSDDSTKTGSASAASQHDQASVKKPD